MKILKPPYETSFFLQFFFVEIFFSNVNFARWDSPLTFYEILWITQTFFLKKVNKQMCFVLTTRLKPCPSKPWSWEIYKKNAFTYAEKANFDRVCMLILFRPFKYKKNCRLNHEHGASLRSRFLQNWGFCKKAYKW